MTRNRESQWFKRSPFGFLNKFNGTLIFFRTPLVLLFHPRRKHTNSPFSAFVSISWCNPLANFSHCILPFRRSRAAGTLGWWWRVVGFHIVSTTAFPHYAPLVSQAQWLAYATLYMTRTLPTIQGTRLSQY